MTHQLPSFTLRQLAYFVAAADEGTITGAAELLRVSPSAMSDAITELESLLGERLCVRRRAHGLTLTPSGEQLMRHARRMLAEADEVAYGLGSGTEGLSGPITIGCYPTLAPLILPPLLQEFTALHPGVELSITEAPQDQLTAALESGRIDIAFVYDVLVPGAARRAPLFELSAHVLLPPEHRLAGSEAIALTELVNEDLIMLDAAPSSEHIMSVFAAQGLRPTIRHRTKSFEVVRTLVARGLGYGILVSRVAIPHSYEGRPLVALPITPPVKPVGIEVIWSPQHPLPARTRALLEYARTYDWPGADPE